MLLKIQHIIFKSFSVTNLCQPPFPPDFDVKNKPGLYASAIALGFPETGKLLKKESNNGTYAEILLLFPLILSFLSLTAVGKGLTTLLRGKLVPCWCSQINKESKAVTGWRRKCVILALDIKNIVFAFWFYLTWSHGYCMKNKKCRCITSLQYSGSKG